MTRRLNLRSPRRTARVVMRTQPKHDAAAAAAKKQRVGARLLTRITTGNERATRARRRAPSHSFTIVFVCVASN